MPTIPYDSVSADTLASLGILIVSPPGSQVPDRILRDVGLHIFWGWTENRPEPRTGPRVARGILSSVDNAVF